MDNTTVNLPMKDYQAMKKELKQLKTESIYNFSEKEHTDIVHGIYDVLIDINAVCEYMKENNPTATDVYLKGKASHIPIEKRTINKESEHQDYSPIRASNFIMPTLDDDTSDEPLLSIVLDDINSVPVVHYKGEEVNMKQRVSFDWITRREFFNPTYISVEHMDKETQDFNTKVIQHNQPLGRSDE